MGAGRRYVETRDGKRRQETLGKEHLRGIRSERREVGVENSDGPRTDPGDWTSV